MNKSERQIKSTKYILENDKENTPSSDMESLLVSSVRYDNQIQITESQGHQFKSKPSHSQIRKQCFSNVYVDEHSQRKCQQCQKSIDTINENMGMINIRLQQLQSKLNICFSKYGKMQSKVGQFGIVVEWIKEFERDYGQRIKQLMCSVAKNQEENRIRLKERSQEVSRIKKSIARLQSRQVDKMCHQSKLLQHKLQRYKDQQQIKMKQVIQSIEKIGYSQKKISHNTDKSEENTQSFYQPMKKKYFRTYSICDKSKTNESTNISYSRNYQFPK